MWSIIFPATSDAGTLYVPLTSACWIAATFSIRTSESGPTAEAALAAELRVA
jgi:hypothetical protein